MASFIGTNEEFRRYIGPRLRNLVQQITKDHKAEVAKCELCQATENLESTHIEGRGRNQLIDLVLSEFAHNNVVTVDLGVFEERFKEQHNPIEKSILILCRICHRKYDSNPSTVTSTTVNTPTTLLGSTIPGDENSDLLPICLDPADPNEFKTQLLISRLAEIKTTYLDGRVESRMWRANQFKPSSNVLGNLRSRPEYRADVWKINGIARVNVKVKNIA